MGSTVNRITESPSFIFGISIEICLSSWSVKMFFSEFRTDGFIVLVIPCLTVFCFSDCCSDWFDVIVNTLLA